MTCFNSLFNTDHIETYLLSKANIKTLHFYLSLLFSSMNILCLFIKNTEYEDEKALKNPKYKDRAGKRREQIGSEGTFQRDDAPASVHS